MRTAKPSLVKLSLSVPVFPRNPWFARGEECVVRGRRREEESPQYVLWLLQEIRGVLEARTVLTQSAASGVRRASWRDTQIDRQTTVYSITIADIRES